MPMPTIANRDARATALVEMRPGIHVPVRSSLVVRMWWTMAEMLTMTPRATRPTPESTERPVLCGTEFWLA